MSQILLGLCDSTSDYDSNSSNFTINKLGGTPDWLLTESLEFESFESSIRCDNCEGPGLFVCQLYCPMEGSVNHRVLYFFVCPQKVCNKMLKSWIVLRCQTNIEETKQQMYNSEVQINSAFDDFNFDSMDWGAPDDNATRNATEAGGNNIHYATKTDNMTTTMNDALFYESQSINDQNSVNARLNEEQNIDNLIKNIPEHIENYKEVSNMREEAKGTNTKLKDNFLPPDYNMASLSLEESSPSNKVTLDIDTADELILKSSAVPKYLIDNDDNNQLNNVNAQNTSIYSKYHSIVFKPFYIDVIDEVDVEYDNHQLSKHECELLKNYLQQENMSLEDLESVKASKNTKGGGKCTESGDEFALGGMTDVQHDFLQTIRRCPQQIIRYSYKGSALEYNAPLPTAEVPKCQCGSARVFEVQLLSTIINYLVLSDVCPKEQFAILEALDFGSIYAYTCSTNCWDDGVRCKREYLCMQVDDTLSKDRHHSRKGRYKF